MVKLSEGETIGRGGSKNSSFKDGTYRIQLKGNRKSTTLRGGECAANWGDQREEA